MLPVSCQGPERLTVPALLPGSEARVETVCSAVSAVSAVSAAMPCVRCAACWAGLGWGGLIPRPSTFFSRLALLHYGAQGQLDTVRRYA